MPLATESELQRNSNARKLYPADPGLIKAFDASGRSNVGYALETGMLNELERRCAEIGYAKTPDGLEVHFLARDPIGGAGTLALRAASAGALPRCTDALERAGSRGAAGVRVAAHYSESRMRKPVDS